MRDLLTIVQDNYAAAAHACQQEARRAKDDLGHEQLAVLKAVWQEVME